MPDRDEVLAAYPARRLGSNRKRDKWCRYFAGPRPRGFRRQWRETVPKAQTWQHRSSFGSREHNRQRFRNEGPPRIDRASSNSGDRRKLWHSVPPPRRTKIRSWLRRLTILRFLAADGLAVTTSPAHQAILSKVENMANRRLCQTSLRERL